MDPKGFTLLELLIALVIVAILSSISYPLYWHHLTRVHRIEARTGLYTLACQLEQYYTQHHSYEGATLAKLHTPEITENGFYALHMAIQQQGNSYLLKAEPQGPQAGHDNECGTLTLDALGKRGISGTATISECWR